MKKLLEKDKRLRVNVKNSEKQHFIFKSIYKNSKLITLVRWKAFLKLNLVNSKNSKVSLSPKCLYTRNKKKFNKLTFFSRLVFLTQIRSGNISGIKKASW